VGTYVQRFRSVVQAVTKYANFLICIELWPLLPWKGSQIQNLGSHLSLFDEPRIIGDDRVIRWGVLLLPHFLFLVLAPWWPSQESDRTETPKHNLHHSLKKLRSVPPIASELRLGNEYTDGELQWRGAEWGHPGGQTGNQIRPISVWVWRWGRSIGPVVLRNVPILYWTLNSVTLKSRSNQNPGDVPTIKIWRWSTGDQIGNQIGPKFGMSVCVSLGYIHTKFQVDRPSGYETCQFRCLYWTSTSVTLKGRSNQKPG
jgi:hypothetical protein